MGEIIPGLYLGGVITTTHKQKLAIFGISHVLSVGHHPYKTPDGAVAKYVEIEDDT